MSNGSGLSACVEGIVSFLSLAGACSDSCSLGSVVIAYQLLLAVWLVLAMWTGLTGFVWLATVGDERHMIFECAALAALRQQHADLFTSRTDTMRSFFGQQDHLGVLNYVIDCLDHMDI